MDSEKIWSTKIESESQKNYLREWKQEGKNGKSSKRIRKRTPERREPHQKCLSTLKHRRNHQAWNAKRLKEIWCLWHNSCVTSIMREGSKSANTKVRISYADKMYAELKTAQWILIRVCFALAHSRYRKSTTQARCGKGSWRESNQADDFPSKYRRFR